MVGLGETLPQCSFERLFPSLCFILNCAYSILLLVTDNNKDIKNLMKQ
jgi:hypothetical protein